MGSMKNGGRERNDTAARPAPKSKNKKSIGPSLHASSGTRKTDNGSRKGQEKAKGGARATSGAAVKSPAAKKGTVSRASKASRGRNSANAETAVRTNSVASRRRTTPVKTKSKTGK